MTGWFEQTGVILFVEHYERCVAFDRDVLELAVEEEKPALVRFDFGGAYLMVERGGVGRAESKSRAENPTTLRFNVADIEEAVAWLRAKGVAPEVHRWEWGITANFLDPDGNRLELRDPFHAGGAVLRPAAKSPI